MQVLQAMPTDLAMEVIRKAPGKIPSKLNQIPESLRSLAALASCPGLATVCKLPKNPLNPEKIPDTPALRLCVDCSQEQQIPESGAEAGCSSDGLMQDDLSAPVSDPSGNIWVHNHNVSKHDRSLFYLQQRPGMVCCDLLACSNQLREVNIVLPRMGALVVSSGSLDIQNVNIKGMAPLSSVVPFVLASLIFLLILMTSYATTVLCT